MEVELPAAFLTAQSINTHLLENLSLFFPLLPQFNVDCVTTARVWCETVMDSHHMAAAAAAALQIILFLGVVCSPFPPIFCTRTFRLAAITTAKDTNVSCYNSSI